MQKPDVFSPLKASSELYLYSYALMDCNTFLFSVCRNCADVIDRNGDRITNFNSCNTSTSFFTGRNTVSGIKKF